MAVLLSKITVRIILFICQNSHWWISNLYNTESHILYLNNPKQSKNSDHQNHLPETQQNVKNTHSDHWMYQWYQYFKNLFRDILICLDQGELGNNWF